MGKSFFKPKVRKKLIRAVYSDPYLDEYVNMECLACRRIIHYGYTRCPKCGAAIDQNAPEVQEARKRYIQDRVAGIGLCLVVAVIGIFMVISFFS